MLRNMLDTNLCIHLLRDRPAGLRPRFNAEAETLCLSTVTLTELLHGAARSAKPVENRREVERMAARLVVLGFDTRQPSTPAEFMRTWGAGGSWSGRTTS